MFLRNGHFYAVCARALLPPMLCSASVGCIKNVWMRLACLCCFFFLSRQPRFRISVDSEWLQKCSGSFTARTQTQQVIMAYVRYKVRHFDKYSPTHTTVVLIKRDTKSKAQSRKHKGTRERSVCGTCCNSSGILKHAGNR